MKAALAILFFAASLLAISSAADCPVGQLIDGRIPTALKDCDTACVEYKCGHPTKQYGCSDDAYLACPAFKDKVSRVADTHGYCKMEKDGQISYFYPACEKGFKDYTACRRTRDFAVSFLTFMDKCKELPNGQGKIMRIQRQSSDPVGPLCPFGERHNDNISDFAKQYQYCSSCVQYQCGQEHIQLGCPENAFMDCPAFAEFNETKADRDHNQYCKNYGNGSLALYLPAGSAFNHYENFSTDASYIVAWHDLKGRCAELGKDDDFVTRGEDFHGSRICPRKTSLNFDEPAEYQVNCDSCAFYQCKQPYGHVLARSGCVEDFFFDCYQYEDVELSEIKSDNALKMLYCNDNVFYLSNFKEAVPELMEKCQARAPGSPVLTARQRSKNDTEAPGSTAGPQHWQKDTEAL